MRNKLEEINLAMLALLKGETVANQIAGLFTDEDIERTKKQIIVNKRKKASMARWGKKSEPVIEEEVAKSGAIITIEAPVAKGEN